MSAFDEDSERFNSGEYLEEFDHRDGPEDACSVSSARFSHFDSDHGVYYEGLPEGLPDGWPEQLHAWIERAERPESRELQRILLGDLTTILQRREGDWPGVLCSLVRWLYQDVPAGAWHEPLPAWSNSTCAREWVQRRRQLKRGQRAAG